METRGSISSPIPNSWASSTGPSSHSSVAFLLKCQGNCQAGSPWSTSPVRVITSMPWETRIHAKMLVITTTRQLAEIDISHFVFLTTFPLLAAGSCPSHQSNSLSL